MQYIDLRDLEGEERKNWKYEIDVQTSATYKELEENSPLMIPEEKWEDHAWDEANAAFGVDLDKGNLAIYFDLDKWADDLKMDYSEIEVDGTTYYFRDY